MNKDDLPIVWTAIITPLREDGSLDFDALSGLVEAQVQAGNGILFLGSTGEALNLSGPEKKQILDWVSANPPKTPSMCGVGGSDLGATLDWVRMLNTYPFDGYLMVTPPYAKPGDRGQLAWFTALLNAADKPCLLYNVPGRTASALSQQALSELANHENFLGIKESSGSLEAFVEYRKMLPDHAVYCGDDLLMPEFAKAGASGLISVASNAWPAQVHQYAQQCLDGSFDARSLWKQASELLFTASNPVPVKHLLHQKGVIASAQVKLPLSHQDMGDDQELLDIDAQITRWS